MASFFGAIYLFKQEEMATTIHTHPTNGFLDPIFNTVHYSTNRYTGLTRSSQYISNLLHDNNWNSDIAKSILLEIINARAFSEDTAIKRSQIFDKLFGREYQRLLTAYNQTLVAGDNPNKATRESRENIHSKVEEMISILNGGIIQLSKKLKYDAYAYLDSVRTNRLILTDDIGWANHYEINYYIPTTARAISNTLGKISRKIDLLARGQENLNNLHRLVIN